MCLRPSVPPSVCFQTIFWVRNRPCLSFVFPLPSLSVLYPYSYPNPCRLAILTAIPTSINFPYHLPFPSQSSTIAYPVYAVAVHFTLYFHGSGLQGETRATKPGLIPRSRSLPEIRWYYTRVLGIALRVLVSVRSMWALRSAPI